MTRADKHRSGDFTLKISSAEKAQIELTAESKYGWIKEIIPLKHILPLGDIMEKLKEDAEEKEYKNLGKALFSVFFPSDIASLLKRSLNESFKLGLGFRLIIEDNSQNLYHYPWEYLHNGEEFLLHSFRLSIIRKIPLKYSIRPLRMKKNERWRILAILSSPLDLDIQKKELRLHREIATFHQATLPLVYEGKLETLILEKATLSSIREAAIAFNPHILYLTGHGGINNDGVGVVVLENDEGMTYFVRAEELANLFKGNPHLRLIILNICQSLEEETGRRINSLAQAVCETGVSAVVAIQGVISYESSFLFSQTLFLSLSVGLSLERAIIEARRAIFLEGGVNSIEWGAPVLLMTEIPPYELELNLDGEIKEAIGNNRYEKVFLPADLTRRRGSLQWSSLLNNRALPNLFPSRKRKHYPPVIGPFYLDPLLVNRRREMRTLEEGIFEKRIRNVLIQGEIGSGKTTLINAFITRNLERFDAVFIHSFSWFKPFEIISNEILNLPKPCYKSPIGKNIKIKLADLLVEFHFLLVFEDIDLIPFENQEVVGEAIEFFSTIANSSGKSVQIFSFIQKPSFFSINENYISLNLGELQPQQVRHLMLELPNLRHLTLNQMTTLYRKFGGNPGKIKKINELLGSLSYETLINQKNNAIKIF